MTTTTTYPHNEYHYHNQLHNEYCDHQPRRRPTTLTTRTMTYHHHDQNRDCHHLNTTISTATTFFNR